MKKIVKLLILVFVCFLPVMVDAKVDYDVNWKVDRDIFIYEDDDKYYCLEGLDTVWQVYIGDIDHYYLNVYDDKGKFLKREKLFNSNDFSFNDFKKTKKFKDLSYYLYFNDEKIYNEEDNELYSVNYLGNHAYYYLYEDGNFNFKSIDFENDEDLAKRILGKRYDIVYDKYKDEHVYKIDEFDNMYIFDYYNDDKVYIKFIDKNLNELFSIENDSLNYNGYSVWVTDEYIYLSRENNKIEIYNFNGELYDFVEIDTSFLEDTSDICGNYNITKLYVDNRKVTLNYNFISCPSRIDSNDIVKGRKQPISYVLNLDLKFDVIKVESEGGDFSYTEKVDEDGNHYVELNISTEDGYSVKEIIVTDINGERIEVTNNKFYMPFGDVNVEVKYVKGEYLPIPDTFLGKSVNLILIGLILISLGFYTINYVRQE